MVKQNGNLIVIGIIIILVLLLNQTSAKVSVKENWFLRLFDAEGNEIEVPSEFTSQLKPSLFAIWTTEDPTFCNIDDDCPGVSLCWNNVCNLELNSLYNSYG